MSAPAAFAGSYADIAIRKTRSVFVVSVEFPLERYQAFVAAFGGPTPGAEIPVALARLAPEKPATASRSANGGDAKERRPLKELPFPQQAALRCGDAEFRHFLFVEIEADLNMTATADAAADFVRNYCGVSSRSEIRPETNAGILWERLNARFTAWRHEAPIAEPQR